MFIRIFSKNEERNILGHIKLNAWIPMNRMKRESIQIGYKERL